MMKNKITIPPNEIRPFVPEEVKSAFDNWMKCNLWRSALTRSESVKLGAAKRKLNAALQKHALTFDVVAQQAARRDADGGRRMSDIKTNPDGEENERATRQHEREVRALTLWAERAADAALTRERGGVE